MAEDKEHNKQHSSGLHDCNISVLRRTSWSDPIEELNEIGNFQIVAILLTSLVKDILKFLEYVIHSCINILFFKIIFFWKLNFHWYGS